MGTPAILQMLSGATASQQAGSLDQIKAAVTRLRSLSNPKAAIQQMVQQRNPGMAKAMDYVSQNGGDPKAAFEKLARERGIDPVEIEALMR